MTVDSASWSSDVDYHSINGESIVVKNKRCIKRFCWIFIPILLVTVTLICILLLPGKVSVVPVYIMHNAAQYTMDPNHVTVYKKYLDSGATQTPFTAFVVGSDGLFYDVGDESLIQRDEYSRLQRINLFGSPVFPGFHDAHVHTLSMGLLEQEVDLSSAQSEADAVNMVHADAVAKGKDLSRDPGYFLVGGRWDQNRWPEHEFPSKASLDSLFPNVPVILNRIDYHALWVNSAAMRAIGGVPNVDPEGGTIVRDADGVPTGLFLDNAMDQFLKSNYATYPENVRHEALRASLKQFSMNGITTVHDASLLDTDFDLMYAELFKGRNVYGATDLFPVRVVGMLDVYHSCKIVNGDVECPSRFPDNQVRSGRLGHLRHIQRKLPVKHRYLSLDLIQDGTTSRLSMPAAKLVLDGALGSRGAKLIEEYSDSPGNYGLEQYPGEVLTNIMNTLATKGFQICAHAIGDYAVQQAIHHFKGQISRGLGDGWGSRHRIEHLQIATDTDIQLLRNSGIVPSMQPTHATSDMLFAEARLGKKRLEHAYSWREALDLTGSLAFGTDAPIEVVNPLRTLHSAVSMQDEQNSPNGGWLPSHVVSRYQAMTAMTWGAAYAAKQDHIVGSIAKGRAADFVIMSSDLMKVPVDKILASSVRATFIDGNAVYINKEEMKWAGSSHAYFALNYDPTKAVHSNNREELSVHKHHTPVPKHLRASNTPLSASPCLAQASFLDFMYRTNKQSKL